MSSASEVLSDARYIEPVPSHPETQFRFSCFRFFYEKGEIRSVERGENLIDELRAKFVFRNTVSLKNFLSYYPSNDRPSSEGDEILQYMSVEFQIVELLALVRVEDDFLVLGTKSQEPTRHLKSTWANAVFEAVRVPNNPEKEQCGYLRSYIHVHLFHDIVQEFTSRTRPIIDDITDTEHTVSIMVIDIDDGGISENIRIPFQVFSYESELPAITNENRVEFFPGNRIGSMGMDIQKIKKGGNREFVDYLGTFPDASEIKIEGHTRSISVTVDISMSYDEKVLSFLNYFLNFPHFLLLFIHFYVF